MTMSESKFAKRDRGDERCGECWFFGDVGLADKGICQRFPPLPAPDNYHMLPDQGPLVHEDNWCGEFDGDW
jgi:hypothetical protein